MDRKHIAALHDTLKQANFSPGLIIVDTLSRVAVGADENSAKDMGQVIAGFDDLKRRLDATVLVIHHTRKDGASERGSSVVRGAADVMIACEKQEALASQEAVSLTCAKMRDDEPFKTFSVRLEKVDLKNGKSSLVLGNTFDIKAARRAQDDRIVEVLESKFADHGTKHGELKKAFVDSGAGSESSFDRAWRDLKSSSRIRTVESGGKTLYYPAEGPKSAASDGSPGPASPP
jgi:RecA-family ATPase